MSINKNFYYSYKVQITPSMIYVVGMTQDATNRVVRDFIELDKSDSLLRVRFTNENGQPDHYNDEKK